MYLTSTYLFQNHSDSKENVTVDEVVAVVKNLRYNDLRKCNVILDIENGVILKCRNFRLYDDVFVNSINGPDYQRVLDYFQSIHPKEIGDLLEAIRNIKKIQNLRVVDETVTIGE